MTVTLCIALQVLPDSPVRISADISDIDKRLLEQFVQHAEVLLATKVVSDGLPCKLSISVKAGAFGGDIQVELPNEDAMAVVLHRLRPLILQREAASFLNTCALLGKYFIELNLRAIIREQRELFHNTDRAQTWAINLDDVRINAESILQDWLNGIEYHTDADRKARIEELFEDAEVLVRYCLVSMLLNKIDAIRGILELGRVALGHTQTVRFEPSLSGQRGLVILHRC